MIQNQYVMYQIGYSVPKWQASKYNCVVGIVATNQV